MRETSLFLIITARHTPEPLSARSEALSLVRDSEQSVWCPFSWSLALDTAMAANWVEAESSPVAKRGLPLHVN
jgi:hypothetical protein